MFVFTHGTAGIARATTRGPWYLFTGETNHHGECVGRRIPPGRIRAIRALQHAAPAFTYPQPAPVRTLHRKAAA